MTPNDTSQNASKVYFELLAEMTPAERLRIGAGMWEAANSLQWATARRKYPHANEAELAFQIAVTGGAELARAAYRRP